MSGDDSSDDGHKAMDSGDGCGGKDGKEATRAKPGYTAKTAT
jgi:hypothetical protein